RQTVGRKRLPDPRRGAVIAAIGRRDAVLERTGDGGAGQGDGNDGGKRERATHGVILHTVAKPITDGACLPGRSPGNQSGSQPPCNTRANASTSASLVAKL